MKTFTAAIRDVLDCEVPADQPGLISYDHYWGILRDNPSLRSLPGVAKVVEASDVLAGRVQNAYTRQQLLPMAQRIIRCVERPPPDHQRHPRAHRRDRGGAAR